ARYSTLSSTTKSCLPGRCLRRTCASSWREVGAQHFCGVLLPLLRAARTPPITSTATGTVTDNCWNGAVGLLWRMHFADRLVERWTPACCDFPVHHADGTENRVDQRDSVTEEDQG